MLGLTLLLCANAMAQGNRYTIKGRVIDNNDQAVPGVTVLLRGSGSTDRQLETTSVADGSYVLGVSVPPGSYSLTFSSIGYTALNQRLAWTVRSRQ
ncbi:carboxypeptidase-like regulatory domain-containing protein [Spirosoma utsteinense]|uniref:Carboxypeptidase regulatory-like domain-containing protein n=1 Tax=Spirosoma utsteinense TaxID=2585773 RepID=A0ABR6W446_9BACT|nr:carboxypeptidase-like regulatory domain-containing protein [Spirosoma utsteinense]MBC3787080.1 hypothetical protein [Spirosoma utsteinense]MBC3791371.1 hypothetical protein [Spirosoma utsteinense]